MKYFLALLSVMLGPQVGPISVMGAFSHNAAGEFSDANNTEASRWSYRFKSASSTRDGNYPRFAQHGGTGNIYSPLNGDLSVWRGTGNSGAPWMGVQTTGLAQVAGESPNGLIFPSGEILAQPANSGLVVLTWLSPATTVVEIRFRFADQQDDPACGNGIGWFVELGTNLLASGSIAPGGDTGLTNLHNVVVHAGDRIHFIIAALGDGSCDATLMQATVAEPVDDALYDAAADLLADETLPGAQNGTNGVWIYGGYNPSVTQFTPFTPAQHLDNWPANLQSGMFQGYASVAGDGTPTLVVNTNRVLAQSPCCGITPIEPGRILMHPSAPGGGNFGDTYDVPAIRWTAPGQGTALVTANFLQRHGLAQRGYVWTNGVVAMTGIAARNSGTTLSVTGLVLEAGDTIDVGVAPGPSGYGSGSTETAATIAFTAAVTGRPLVIVSEPADQTVQENNPAVFQVQINNAPATYQWQRNGLNITGANRSTYTVTNSLRSDDGAFFRCVITNSVNTNITRAALLTVFRDSAPPTLASVQNDGLQILMVMFSEAVEPASATNRANYLLDRGVTVFAATFGNNDRTILLTTSPLILELPSILTVSRVRDLAAVPNVIVENAQLSFTPRGYAPQEIGNPTPPGLVTAVAGGYDIVGGGNDIGGRSDQFQYGYERRTGDFDVEVRLEVLGLSDAWAKAGLMARETLVAGSPFAAALATPSIAGSLFESRTTSGGVTAMSGSFPVNYPFTWLRLQRVGNLFSGFASLDGEEWALLGSATLVMSNTIHFGMAVASHNTNQTTLARFRDLSSATGRTVGAISLRYESPAPSSRRTGLTISEIMYSPPTRTDGRDLEFVELFNTLPYFEDLSGYRLAGDIEFEFPAGTRMPAGGILVIAKRPTDLNSVVAIQGLLGPYARSLPDGAGAVRLLNASGAVLLEVSYSARAPWPAACAGAGHSLVLARPSLGERNPAAWAASDLIGGSPGALEAARPEPLRSVTINEFLANTDPPDQDFIELHNRSNQAVDLSGSFLSDAASARKFRIPPGTLLAPRGFVWFDQTQLGFALDSDGEGLYLVNSNQTRVIDAVTFGGQARGVSTGRFPDGAPEFHELIGRTPGTANRPGWVRDIVINEIMYHPISGQSDDEYVELLNQGTNAVSLAGWTFTDGITFDFPTNAIIPAKGFLVVARNVTNLLARYPNLTSANTVGDYDGMLANGGERLALSMPELPVRDDGTVPPNSAYIVADEVTYGTGGRWGRWADGGGSSLELIDPRADHRQASNWADSDESSKTTQWTTIEHTGVLDLGSVDHAASAVQVLLLGAGECLVDQVEVLSGGVNRVANSTFETGIAGWRLEGNHDASGLETNAGYQSARSLHLRASGRGGPVADRVRTPLTSSVPQGSTATLRAQVRWLRGCPDVLVRLRGNWLEAAGSLTVPRNLGTPGAPNSRAVTNAGPAIFEVSHHPVLPAANQSVLVTARVVDPDGLNGVQLRYRVNPSATLVVVPMLDDGTGGDAVMGDGLYSATLPGQAAKVLVAFHVRATDGFNSAAATTTFPADAPTRECLVRFGEVQPSGSLGTYRLWMTSATHQRWSSRGNNSNQPLDCTFVNGNLRVIYNMGALYSGSPFKTPGYDSPTGAGCDYSLDFPEDDRFLGATSFEISTPGNFPGTPEPTALREQLSYWIARQLGLPFMERRFIHLFVNGTERGLIMEDTQLPNADVVEQWFPDDPDGELFKTSFSFEIDEATPSPLTWMPASLRIFNTTGGVRKTARYRWNWQPRAVQGSAHDYAGLFRLVAAANASGSAYTEAVESLVDAEQWMRFFAYEHIVGQWDSLGYNTGSNVYPYKGRNGRWTLLPWDVDISFVADGPTTDLFVAADPPLARMNSHPPFRRAYWRALQDAVAGPLLDANVAPVAAARHAALRANGLNVTPPDDATTYIRQRRAYILGQLNAVESSFSVTGSTQFSTNNNLATLAGTAPLAATDILANGKRYRVTWTGVKTWSLIVPLAPGTNVLDLRWMDRFGVLLTNAPIRLTINYVGPEVSPTDLVVFNEIMHAPVLPDTEFVEIFNSSSSSGFNLSRWRVNPLDFTFPDGTVLAPKRTLLLVKDRAAFATAYGAEPVVLGEFSGRLPAEGGTLELIRPGVISGEDLVVDAVRYEAVDPWPAGARATGRSLQLIDAAQDNRRVANWSDGSGWRFFSVTGLPGPDAARFSVWSDAAGEVYLDQFSLVAGRVAELGSNYLHNGQFEGPTIQPWQTSSNHSNSALSTEVRFRGNSSLRLISSGPGGSNAAVYQVLNGIDPTNTYTLSFWYLPNAGTNNLNFRLSSGFRSTTPIQLRPALSTPGAINAATAFLPEFPTLWLNEVQPENITGLRDGTGHRDPWIEVWNAGSQPVSLDGFYLANNYSNLTQWAFPPGSTIGPGEFKIVFADAQPGESTGTEWHANFRPNPGFGSVALSQWVAEKPRLVDYLNYNDLLADWSYGDFPDGQPLVRQHFFRVTPGTANLGESRLVHPIINEWMASNTRTLRNEANGNLYDDWFELYNPGPNTLDVGGYFLTDTLDDPTQFQIPAGYQIGPRGFLLVWADGWPALNAASRPELHVNFQLSRTGETIGLFAADGTRVDAVTFGAQASDVSEGRNPDGASTIEVTSSASPGRSNSPSVNTPPILEPLPERALYLGETLHVTALGSDTDLPPQALRYSLAQSPAGANIDAVTGAITWTPNAGQTPSTSQLQVRVTDDGSPNLAATQFFSVRVLRPPMLTLAAGAKVTLGFNALSGRLYGIEWKEGLDYGRWTNLRNTTALPSDQVVLVEDSLPSAEERFYRLVTPPGLNPPPGPIILRSPRSVVKKVGEPVELNVFAIGTGPLTYQWYLNDKILAGATASNLVAGNASLAIAGAYLVVVRDQAGSTTNLPPARVDVRP